jgi:hypothetical protein
MKKFLILLSILMLSIGAQAQVEELNQRTALFLDEVKSTFKVKSLNGSEPDYGVLIETEHVSHTYYQLKQIEKELNELGNKVRPTYNLSTFAYENEEELLYALKFWFKNFIGGKRVTPGRDYRSVDHVEPALIIIENNYIAILTLSCYATDIDEFRDWRSQMLGVFGGPNSMVIEIGCNGPIEWTKNAPDPKDMKWRR